jgi:SPP1 family predicted phage head-tail adaptor
MPAPKYTVSMLDQLVTLKRATLAADDQGGSTTTWATVASAWAHIRPLTGFELVANARFEQHVNYLVVIRADGADVREGDAIEWEGQLMPVRYSMPVPRSPWLEIHAQRGAEPTAQ